MTPLIQFEKNRFICSNVFLLEENFRSLMWSRYVVYNVSHFDCKKFTLKKEIKIWFPRISKYFGVQRGIKNIIRSSLPNFDFHFTSGVSSLRYRIILVQFQKG